ncbi:FGGY-family carbohydrate kinase [Psychrosphaera algicola]|uniref:FGGY-family carbohydrate kinase n=1 Tax=Psychrosphaera algicola TaxID=3023714 RepID=A0ABT5FGC6_9GAMM|nr:FGGY-family carbohydrate kinase [Psychrosphaera sp. G1-22]MDC2889747.1 FGGY-family carbohydrate kinase [Psychrosphaera sp. G1-22]
MDTLNPATQTSDISAGQLTKEWADKLGLPAGIAVGYGAFDCHMGAVAANVRPNVLTKVMGTSTCDITVATPTELGDICVPGICGQVNGSVIPGMIGLEAGQSAFGDLYAWFKKVLLWPTRHVEGIISPAQLQQLEDSILIDLSRAAQSLPIKENDIVSLDWVNGRRTPDADQNVSMALTGIKMGADAPHLFKAIVEATAFGARAITERFQQSGIPISSIVTIGGISKKSDYVMQTCADIWKCPIEVLDSDQSCALGAAIMASVAAGKYPSVEAAQQVMASPVCKTYQPNADNIAVYDALYAKYQALGKVVSGDL